MVKIGNIELGEFPLLLAPMEDVSDPPFRALCKQNGCDMMYTEFISVEGLIRDAEKSLQKLDIYDEERPIGVQIFGAELDSMMRAAEIVEAAKPEVLDINPHDRSLLTTLEARRIEILHKFAYILFFYPWMENFVERLSHGPFRAAYKLIYRASYFWLFYRRSRRLSFREGVRTVYRAIADRL